MPMTTSPSHDSAGILLASIEKFLRTREITAVHFADEGGTPPPPLAYHVLFPRVSVILSGEDSMWVEQQSRPQLVRLRAGMGLVVPANRWNRPLWNQRVVTLNLLFGRKQLGLSLVRHNGKTRQPPAAFKISLYGSQADTPRSIMQVVLALPHGQSSAARPLVTALLHSCHEAMLERSAPAKGKAHNLYESICLHLQEQFQFPITRDSVAKHFRISPAHVSRLFQHEGLVPFNDYLTYVRLNRAKYLLKHHHQNLGEIAALCGFSDASYFCRVFKKMTRQTPSAYRQAAMPGAARSQASR